MPEDTPYDQVAELGRGGMAVVYRSVRRGTTEEDEVALKRPLPWPLANERLRREADLLGAIDHPHVIPVLDSGTDHEGHPWYTMPLARGSLRSLWESGALGSDPSSLCRAILDQVGAGLAAMHAQELVHRDVKPDNILALKSSMDGGSYRWVVADCGLARRPLGQTTAALTGSASQLGTAGYMAPESYGDPHNVSAAADVYGLGRVLAWLLTGQRPVLTRPLLPDGEWRGIVRAFTQDEPLRRPQTIAAAQDFATSHLATPAVSPLDRLRVRIDETSGRLPPDDTLWQVVLDHIDDEAFMFDEAVAISTAALEDFARTRPESAAAAAEAMGHHLAGNGYGSRSWDRLNTHLRWIQAVLRALIAVREYGLFEDVATAYTESVALWDRYPHNNLLRTWLTQLDARSGTAMARAIRQSGSVDYFKATFSNLSPVTSPELRALLSPQ